MTPGALISSSADADDQVTTARSPTAATARSQNSCAVELLVPGQQLERRLVEELLERAAAGCPRARACRSRKPARARCRPGSRPRTPRRAPPRGSGRRPRGRRPASSGRRRCDRGARDVPDQRAVGDDRQAVRADVLEDVLGPAQRAAGHEDDRDAAAVELREHVAGVRRRRCRRSGPGCRRGRWRPAGRPPVRVGSWAGSSGQRTGHHQLAVLVGPAELGEAALGQHPQAGGVGRAGRSPGPGRPAGRSRRAARAAPRSRSPSRGPPRPGRTRPRSPGPAARAGRSGRAARRSRSSRARSGRARRGAGPTGRRARTMLAASRSSGRG